MSSTDDRRERPGEGDPTDGDKPDSDAPQGSDFELDPPPARSDQLPEDAPEPVAPD
jgi:hypothetical protein